MDMNIINNWRVYVGVIRMVCKHDEYDFLQSIGKLSTSKLWQMRNWDGLNLILDGNILQFKTLGSRGQIFHNNGSPTRKANRMLHNFAPSQLLVTLFPVFSAT